MCYVVVSVILTQSGVLLPIRFIHLHLFSFKIYIYIYAYRYYWHKVSLGIKYANKIVQMPATAWGH